MSGTYVTALLHRATSKLVLAIIGASAFGACSAEPPGATRSVGSAGSGGKAGSSAGTAGQTAGGGSGGGGGVVSTAGTAGAGGTYIPPIAGTGGLVGTAGTGGGGTGGGGTGGGGTGGGGTGGGGTGGSGGKAGGGSGGVVNNCDTDAGGADGVSGAGGASESPCVTNPIPPRTTCWTATASHQAGGDPAAEAIDASTGTRFSTGKDQSGNEWLQIDFGASVGLTCVQMNTSSTNDFPVMYEVRVSDTANDTVATPVATGAGTTAIDACFPVATGQYLLISQTGTGTSWWSVHDLNVSCE